VGGANLRRLRHQSVDALFGGRRKVGHDARDAVASFGGGGDAVVVVVATGRRRASMSEARERSALIDARATRTRGDVATTRWTRA
jgi:hypothetical protein|tara:strand:- start:1368 stop:1622 length:255 start_codon:yes stop_codon:yes gene_type:complete